MPLSQTDKLLAILINAVHSQTCLLACIAANYANETKDVELITTIGKLMRASEEQYFSFLRVHKGDTRHEH